MDLAFNKRTQLPGIRAIIDDMIFLVLALTNYTADVFVSIPATDVSCLISVAAEDCRKFLAVLNVCMYDVCIVSTQSTNAFLHPLVFYVLSVVHLWSMIYRL
jgi:hypothetical protein